MPPRKASKGAAASKSAPAKKKVAANGYKLADPVAPGIIIKDMTKKEWVIGKSIGQGGFGEIYLASNDVSRAVRDTDRFVVKVEPHSNGPLFTEMHCYMRIAKPDLIDSWMKQKKLKRFGMPKYLGSGSFDYKNQKYRFMVMERFGSDLQKILEQHNKKFSFKTVYQVGLEVIDVLEYIHDKGYIHADIKASNLLIGYDKGTEDQVFLVDYGLACRYAIDGVHKEYKYDARKAHDGTIEFTSRDAHIGAHSRRGDLEILGFNLAQWLCMTLPWEDNLTDCDYVANQKRWYMDNVEQFIDKCFPDVVPPGLQEYLTYVASLTFDEAPDYDKCRSILRKGLIERGHKDDGKLVFMSATPKPISKKPKSRLANKRGSKRKRSEEEENIGLAPIKVLRTSPRSPCKSTTNRINTRLCPRKSLVGLSLSTVKLPKVLQLTDPEDILIEKENEKMAQRQRLNRIKKIVKKDTSLDNPTPHMLALMAKIREKSDSPPICTKKHKHKGSCLAPRNSVLPTDGLSPSEFTPQMEEIMKRIKEREEKQQKNLSSLSRRGNSRPPTPQMSVEDIENSNDSFYPGEDVFTPSSKNNNNIDNNKPLKFGSKSLPKKSSPRSPPIIIKLKRNPSETYTVQISPLPRPRKITSYREDPYEFIDDILDFDSPSTYKEFQSKHSSPSAPKKKVSQSKNDERRPGVRKSCRKAAEISHDYVQCC